VVTVTLHTYIVFSMLSLSKFSFPSVQKINSVFIKHVSGEKLEIINFGFLATNFWTHYFEMRL
jgi:hypothetical protein